MAGATASEMLVFAPTAVLLVRDDALRETIATVVGELSNTLVTIVDNVDAARRAMHEYPSAVLVVAPEWGDTGVAKLLRELRPMAVSVVVVSASPEDAALAVGASFVRAPFDVDTLIDAIRDASVPQRPSGMQPIHH